MNGPAGCLEVGPALGPPDVVLVASPSKSATHRAILIGLLSPHTIIERPLLSKDTIASLRVAAALGARTSAEPETEAGKRLLGAIGGGIVPIKARNPGADAAFPQAWEGVLLDDPLAALSPNVPRPLLAAQVRLHIERGGDRPSPRMTDVDCANSGTTLRLATAIAAGGDAPLTLTGDASLVKRPMGPLAEALARLGAEVVCTGQDGRPPVRVKGPLAAGRTEIRGDVSSQFVSALLIAAQSAPGPVDVVVTTPLKSAPYVDVTRATLAHFGGRVDATPGSRGAGPTFHVPGPVAIRPTRITVEGDWSSAAFLLVAAAILGGRITLAGLARDSMQGDRAVLDVLEATGCTTAWAPDPERGGDVLTLTAPAGPLRPFTHSFRDTPDLFPPLAVLAARAAGTSRLVDAAHVRLKECDRVAAMAAGLATLGVPVEEAPDALTIQGSSRTPVPPGLVEAHDDHRILMAFAVLGLVGPGPVYITDPGCYHVSYPRFRMDLDTLGGASRVVDRSVAAAARPEVDA